MFGDSHASVANSTIVIDVWGYWKLARPTPIFQAQGRGRGAYGFLFLPLYARIPTEMYRASEQYQEEGRGRYSAAVPGADSGAARVRQTENRNHGRAAEAAPRSTACKIAHPMLKAGKITSCQNVKTGRRR